MTDVNYTDTMVTDMTAMYEANPTLATAKDIAKMLNKSTKSVVAKLVSLGVYQKAERTSKGGGKIVQKADLVKMIQEHFGMEVPSLVKATKADLQKMVDAAIPAEV